MSPTRACPLCEDAIATHMCFNCGFRACGECVVLEDGLCPACGGIVWVDVIGNSPVIPLEEDDEDEEHV